ncbi:MAG TPA: hypothetical protein ENJ84_08765 [Gammaproteobacteria bacterium]|nr:hypothetical protein [Gammaproteobacteria bacterium]
MTKTEKDGFFLHEAVPGCQGTGNTDRVSEGENQMRLDVLFAKNRDPEGKQTGNTRIFHTPQGFSAKMLLDDIFCFYSQGVQGFILQEFRLYRLHTIPTMTDLSKDLPVKGLYGQILPEPFRVVLGRSGQVFPQVHTKGFQSTGECACAGAVHPDNDNGCPACKKC